MSWSPEQISSFETADDFRVAPFRADGMTPGTPTFIWSVVAGGRLFIRAYSGTRSRWFQAACEQKAGQAHIAGETREVRFRPVSDPSLNDAVDDAYRAKYASSSYLGSMVSSRARATTVEVLPAD